MSTTRHPVDSSCAEGPGIPSPDLARLIAATIPPSSTNGAHEVNAAPRQSLLRNLEGACGYISAALSRAEGLAGRPDADQALRRVHREHLSDMLGEIIAASTVTR